jgi:hypothetical protein
VGDIEVSDDNVCAETVVCVIVSTEIDVIEVVVVVAADDGFVRTQVDVGIIDTISAVAVLSVSSRAGVV